MTSRLGNLFRRQTAVQTERQTAVQTGRQNPVLLSTVDKSSIIYDQIPLKNFVGDDARGVLARNLYLVCRLYTSDAADQEESGSAMRGRRK